ncbi:MAG: helix-turn-helix transcriptional regulator [Oscillospiraceae bacterium]|jgi:repressor LexA|nr:helix-turn-helix transcriptional regulator [Oscillospiraceae bacterium]
MSENSIAERIRNLRAMHNLTLEQVARQVGVGKSTVRKWETGQIENMRRDKIAKLAVALHTTPAYLMGWKEYENIPTPVTEDGHKDKNIIKIAGRDGSFQERQLTDEQLAALKAILSQMPDASDYV